MRLSAIFAAATATAAASCLLACGAAAPSPDKLPPRPMTSSAARGHDFESDVAFLAAHGSVVVLEAPSGGRVAVSPSYQGRVMTSAVAPGGDSLGFLHRAFIEAGKTGTAFDNYGGEDRFWLGPEGGQFGLYFPKDAPFTFEAWQTPAAFQEGSWEITHRGATSVGFARALAVTSHAGFPFKLDVTREIDVLSAEAVVAHLGIALSDRVAWVAFESKNAIRNTGAEPWKEETGLVSIWILGMFAPAPDAKVIVPFVRGAAGPIVNDAYFGKIPGDRLQVDEQRGVVVFSADGKQRGKIGLGPARAQAVAGSYSAAARLLTIVQYDKPVGATRYVNSMWETQREPYAGDVLNSYNPRRGNHRSVASTSSRRAPPRRRSPRGRASPTRTARFTSWAPRTISRRSRRGCSGSRSRRRSRPRGVAVHAPTRSSARSRTGSRPVWTRCAPGKTRLCAPR